jgi:pyridine nucleotide-disulfide oxidoreductase family protein
MKRLVLVGAGHAHVEVLRDFARSAGDVELVVVSPYPWLTYSGMVPGFIAGHYTLDECTIDVAALAARANARLLVTAATGLDARARQVRCASGAVVEYDFLCLDVGSQAPADAAAGVERHAVVMRPLERLVKGWTDTLAAAHAGRVHSITLVGTGAAGVELAFAMHHRLRRELGEAAPHLRLIGDSQVAVPGFHAGARRRIRAEIEARRIEWHQGSGVVEVGAGFVRLQNGLEFATDVVFWAAGAAPHRWLAGCGLATDTRGFVLTDERMRSCSHPEVFAAGDCAAQQGHPRPKAGVFAVRAGPALAAGLRAALDGRAPRHFVPRSRYLALLSAGNRYAIGVWDGVSWEGEWVWRWKDRIDREFVQRYRLGTHPGARPQVS